MSKIKLQFILIFLPVLLIFGCQDNTGASSVNIPGSSSDTEFTPEQRLAMVFGPDNPKQFAGWAKPEYASEPWMHQRVRAGYRISTLCTGLEFYYAVHYMYPPDLVTLTEAGYFPVRSNDPLNFEPIVYDRTPQSISDYSSIAIEASPDCWVFKGRMPELWDGEWVEYKIERKVPDGTGILIAENRNLKYQTEIAMRGAFFAELLERILWDYEVRYALMPESADDLLDDLYYVEDEWAMHDPGANFTEPGGFMFGYDELTGRSIAIWRDEAGEPYSLAWQWAPWPDGWEDVPPIELEGFHGMPCPDPDINDIPETILWTCNLID